MTRRAVTIPTNICIPKLETMGITRNRRKRKALLKVWTGLCGQQARGCRLKSEQRRNWKLNKSSIIRKNHEEVQEYVDHEVSAGLYNPPREFMGLHKIALSRKAPYNSAYSEMATIDPHAPAVKRDFFYNTGNSGSEYSSTIADRDLESRATGKAKRNASCSDKTTAAFLHKTGIAQEWERKFTSKSICFHSFFYGIVDGHDEVKKTNSFRWWL